MSSCRPYETAARRLLCSTGGLGGVRVRRRALSLHSSLPGWAAGLLVLRRQRGPEQSAFRVEPSEWSLQSGAFRPAVLHEVEVLARAVLDVAAALRAVPGEHRQAQLPRKMHHRLGSSALGCGGEVRWAVAARCVGWQQRRGRALGGSTLPTTEVEGLLPTSLPLGLALFVVVCELTLASRQARSTNSDRRRAIAATTSVAREPVRPRVERGH